MKTNEVYAWIAVIGVVCILIGLIGMTYILILWASR